ncbi:MAG TPA: exodeoxyribonuclease III [Candidatus Limnocylindrales bacterium]|nr:exodeoxyribonuclease III [Candidatus Limnocylindrales bacterium]
MRIATWNVNSLKARQEKVDWWLVRARPDVLLMQETKLADAEAPVMAFSMDGYQLVHHGEGRWNGVAAAIRDGIAFDDVVMNFGDGPVRNSGAGAAGIQEEDFNPADEARMLSLRVLPAGGEPLRVVSLYAPNGRVVGSPFYVGKLRWFERARRWLQETRRPDEQLVLGGDLNVAPADADVWDARLAHGGTHVSNAEREVFQALLRWGLHDAFRDAHPDLRGRFTWWDYRAGNFHKNFGMRIDHLLVSDPVAGRVVAVEIDREARKGKPIPSDHAPLVIDLDEPGEPFDPGWTEAGARILARGGLMPSRS